MLIKRNKKLENSLLSCAIITTTTLEQMADLVKSSLLFSPGAEERLEKLLLLNHNITRFIQDIENIVDDMYEHEEVELALMYEAIFSDLRQISGQLYKLGKTLSMNYRKVKVPWMDELVSLQSALMTGLHVLNREISQMDKKDTKVSKWQLTEVEKTAQEHNRMIVESVINETEFIKYAYIVKVHSEIMLRIIIYIIDVCRKIIMIKQFKET